MPVDQALPVEAMMVVAVFADRGSLAVDRARCGVVPAVEAVVGAVADLTDNSVSRMAAPVTVGLAVRSPV